MKQVYVESYYRNGYSRFMQYVNNVSKSLRPGPPKRERIERRLKITEFYDQFGIEAAKKAFGKSRSTIYLWKRRPKSRPTG